MTERLHAALAPLGLGHMPSVRVSSSDADYCTIRTHDRVLKIALRGRSKHRLQSLHDEYSLLRRCAGVTGVPEPLGYREVSGIEVLEMAAADGVSLDTAISFHARVIALARLARILFALGRRGISHNDVRAENILVADSSVTLVDFDQAVVTARLAALTRNFVGGKRSASPPVWGSFMSILFEPFRTWARHNMPRWAKKALGRSTAPPLPEIPSDAPQSLRLLRGAWGIARLSNASSPGHPIAYYSLAVDDFILPGERPWEPRWAMLRSTVGPHVDRVLELGCNMGLLSASLLRSGTVGAALAVDHDQEILRAAQLVAEAWEVQPEFACVEFDSPTQWEAELETFRPDLVFALNVLEWVDDRERFLRFLGRFRELVFEGHDELEVETMRLNRCGFANVTIVGRSERGRQILHARKS